MKVIKRGRKQTGWSTKATCTGSGNGDGGCGAQLLVEQADLFETASTDMKGDTDRFATFQCVECGVLTDLPKMPPFFLPNKQCWMAERVK